MLTTKLFCAVATAATAAAAMRRGDTISPCESGRSGNTEKVCAQPNLTFLFPFPTQAIMASDMDLLKKRIQEVSDLCCGGGRARPRTSPTDVCVLAARRRHSALNTAP
jgi:hypothetical protein